MFYNKDLEISKYIEEKAPPLTIGYSPILDSLLDFLRYNEDSPIEVELHSMQFVPYCLNLVIDQNEYSLATLATKTPIDQAIICVFSQIPDHRAERPPTYIDEVLERFYFCLKQVHCLDYLDFMRHVIQVLTDKVIEFEMDIWAEWEAGTLLAGDEESMKWYHTGSYLPKIFRGWELDAILAACEVVLKRTGNMMEALGDHYSTEMLSLIMQRPQHSTGYFVPHNVST